MRFRDAISFYSPTTSKYNQVPSANLDDIHTVMGVIEENAGLSRSGYYDQLGGDAHLYLPASNQWLHSIDFALDGYFAKYGDRMYRVMGVSRGKAALTTNRMKLVECSLELVKKEVA